MSRYVWDEDGNGIFDNERKAWVVWRGIGGGWYTTPQFQRLLMLALNQDPRTLACRIEDERKLGGGAVPPTIREPIGLSDVIARQNARRKNAAEKLFARGVRIGLPNATREIEEQARMDNVGAEGLADELAELSCDKGNVEDVDG